MNFTELLDAVRDYENAMYSPSKCEVRFGCDCGCGGDSYTLESWNLEEKAADEAVAKMKQICVNLNIEYDGV
jgi:hypothetical protein